MSAATSARRHTGRRTPATTATYEAVVNRQVTHSGDPRLARHASHAVVKTDSRGTRLAKEHKHSRRRIDLAVAAVMAHDRARYHASQPRAQIRARRVTYTRSSREPLSMCSTDAAADGVSVVSRRSRRR